MKKWLLGLTFLLCLFITAACADDVLSIRIDSVAYVETEKSYLVLTCELPETAEVMLTAVDANGILVYQHNYGVCSGFFTSDDIYLRMDDVSSDYHVQLTAGSVSYEMVVRRKVARLKDNTACSVGYPLSELNGRTSWQTVTFLSRSALSSAPLSVPLHASGNATLGKITYRLENGTLKAEIATDTSCDCEITSVSLSIASTKEDVESLGTQNFHGTNGSPLSGIPWPESDIIAVLLHMTVSYNPSSLPGSPQTTLAGQTELWQALKTSW